MIPKKELDELLSGDSAFLKAAMRTLASSLVERLLGEGTRAFIEHEESLAGILRAVNLHAATLGAKRSLLLADDLRGGTPPANTPRVGLPRTNAPAFPDRLELPKVPPTEAIRNLLEREPRLLNTAKRLAKVYGEEHVFSLAKAASKQIVEEAQKTIARMLEEGATTVDARRVLSALGDWTDSFSETVFRTNAASSYTNGLFAMTGDPAVADAIGAMRFVATHDSDVRKNHLAFDGLLAAPDDPVWHVASPPLGFNCRCSIEFVPWDEIPKGRIDRRTKKVTRASLPSGAFPDPGFKVHAFNPGLAIALAH